jgi:hypothetical protein
MMIAIFLVGGLPLADSLSRKTIGMFIIGGFQMTNIEL